MEPSKLLLTLASIAITTGVCMAFFYLGLFGGADAKGLICLSLAVPLPPSSFLPLLGYVHPFFPLAVLVLGFVCSISVALWLAIKNTMSLMRQGTKIFEGLNDEPLWRKALALITGYLTTTTALSSTFYLYPMEQVVTDSQGRSYRKFHFFFDAETDRDKTVSEFIDSLAKVGIPKEVWVSPGLPLLVFMLVALVITLVAGDVVFGAILMLFR